MGTWGTNAFEDDTALEIYDMYCNSLTSFEQLETDFDTVLNKQYNMDNLLMEGFKEPLKVMVASELIAASLGKPTDKFPDESYHEDMEIKHPDLAALRSTLTDTVKDKARWALMKIRDTKNIHLTELWMESDSYEEWKQEIDHLIQRIS